MTARGTIWAIIALIGALGCTEASAPLGDSGSSARDADANGLDVRDDGGAPGDAEPLADARADGGAEDTGAVDSGGPPPRECPADPTPACDGSFVRWESVTPPSTRRPFGIHFEGLDLWGIARVPTDDPGVVLFPSVRMDPSARTFISTPGTILLAAVGSSALDGPLFGAYIPSSGEMHVWAPNLPDRGPPALRLTDLGASVGDTAYVGVTSTLQGELWSAIAPRDRDIQIFREDELHETLPLRTSFQCVPSIELEAGCGTPTIAVVEAFPCRLQVWQRNGEAWLDTFLGVTLPDNAAVPRGPGSIGLEVANDGTLAVGYALGDRAGVSVREPGSPWRALPDLPLDGALVADNRAFLEQAQGALHFAFNGRQADQDWTFYWIYEAGSWRPGPGADDAGRLFPGYTTTGFAVDACGRAVFSGASGLASLLRVQVIE